MIKKLIFLLFAGALLPGSVAAQQYTITAPSKILKAEITDERFDLSGICTRNNRWYVIADKPFNHFLYHIDTAGGKVTGKGRLSVNVPARLDMEGVDAYSEGFFFCDERHSSVYFFNGRDVSPVKMDWGAINIDSWGNRGLEGLAIDTVNNMIYLGKERQPKKLFRVPFSGGKVEEAMVGLTREKQFQVADLKYRDGFLYILDRANYRVLKVNISGERISAVLDYSKVLNHRGEKFYSKARYPMAEALLLTPSSVIIGLDNNGDELNNENFWVKQSGLAGDKPVILFFSRPEQF